MPAVSVQAAASVNFGVWWLHFDLCWNHFFGDAPVCLFTLWQRIFVSLLGLFGSIVLDNSTRRMFVLHMQLEQLSQEKQRLAWDLPVSPRHARLDMHERASHTSANAATVAVPALWGAQLQSASSFDATQCSPDGDECVGIAGAWRNSPNADRSKPVSETSFSDLQFAFAPIPDCRASPPTTPSSEEKRGAVCWQRSLSRSADLVSPRSPAPKSPAPRSPALFGDRVLRGRRQPPGAA